MNRQLRFRFATEQDLSNAYVIYNKWAIPRSGLEVLRLNAQTVLPPGAVKLHTFEEIPMETCTLFATHGQPIDTVLFREMTIEQQEDYCVFVSKGQENRPV